MWTFSVPLFVQVSKAKRFYLNLNGYRNEHYQTLNKAKVLYAAIVKPLLGHIPRNLGRVHLTYKLFPKTRAELDTANVLCIVDKFVCDTLVAAGVIEDDNHKLVISVSFSYGNVDPIDPRAEVTLTLDQPGETSLTKHPTSEKENDHMKITINQAEIEAAIIAMVSSTMTVNPGNTISVDLRATRGEGGYSAEIDISPSGSASAAPAKAPAPASVGTDLSEGSTQAPTASAAVEPASAPEPEAPATEGQTGEAQAEEPQQTQRASLFAAG